MIGFILSISEDGRFGFIQDKSKSRFYFRRDQVKGPVGVGARVNFEAETFESLLASGRLKDENINHRNPRRPQRFRDNRVPRVTHLEVIDGAQQ